MEKTLFVTAVLVHLAVIPMVLNRRNHDHRPILAHSDLGLILEIVQTIHEETERYPASMAEMLNYRDEQTNISVLERIPIDPWGHPYEYELTPDGKPRLRSLGSDGKIGGEGAAADIVLEGDRESSSAPESN